MKRRLHNRVSPRAKIIFVAVFLAVAAWFVWQEYRGGQFQPENSRAPATDRIEADADTSQSPEAAPPSITTLIKNVTLRSESGKVIYRGDVDLTETIDRIHAGRTLDQFRHDGITFQNRERRLPRMPSGYYREFVHPTPRISGPGPQRIVAGKNGELYYTPDHYESFQRLDRRESNEP